MAKSSTDFSPEAITNIYEQIETLDETIDAAGGGGSPKTQLRNQLRDATQEVAQPLVSQIEELSTEYEDDDEAFIGVIQNVSKAFNKYYQQANKKLSELAEARKDEFKQEKVSDKELNAFQEQRQKLYEQLEALETLYSSMGLDFPVELPKKRRFSSGTRGPNIWSKFQYALNGDDLPPELNKLSKIKDKFSMDKTKELKEVMEKQGINKDTAAQPENKTWEVKLQDEIGNEWVLSARPLPEYESEWEPETEGSSSDK